MKVFNPKKKKKKKKKKKLNIVNDDIAYAPTMSNYNFHKHEGITNGPTICIELILSFLHRHNEGISFYKLPLV
jgi:hypothetical protein